MLNAWHAKFSSFFVVLTVAMVITKSNIGPYRSLSGSSPSPWQPCFVTRERKIAPCQCQHQILAYNSWKLSLKWNFTFSSNQIVKLPETDVSCILKRTILLYGQDGREHVLLFTDGDALHLQQSPSAARSLLMTMLGFHLGTICFSFVSKLI